MAVLHTIKSRFNNKLVHPGVILLEEFLRAFDISQNALARHMGVSPRRINEIVLGKRAITVDTALGLADVFGLSPHYWMALQADYDIETARAHRPPHDWRMKPRCPSREYASDPFDAPFVPVFGGNGVGTSKSAMTRGVMDSRGSRGKKR
jgi:addiction module HigA family antidote